MKFEEALEAMRKGCVVNSRKEADSTVRGLCIREGKMYYAWAQFDNSSFKRGECIERLNVLYLINDDFQIVWSPPELKKEESTHPVEKSNILTGSDVARFACASRSIENVRRANSEDTSPANTQHGAESAGTGSK